MPILIDTSIDSVADAMRTVPGAVGVALGGSRALAVDDQYSDVEIYLYTSRSTPSPSDIDAVVSRLDATLTRSDQTIWNRPPWGPHTFIAVSGVRFEIGYRTVPDTQERLSDYLDAHQFHPSKDLHDLAFGHFPSALASCVANSGILWQVNDQLSQLRQRAAEMPEDLRVNLVEHFGRDAYLMITRKLGQAAQRYDVLHFQSCAARAMRSLIISMLALAHTHFPGDKWQLHLLRRINATLRHPFDLQLLERFFLVGEDSPEHLSQRVSLLAHLLESVITHPLCPSHLGATIRDGVNW